MKYQYVNIVHIEVHILFKAEYFFVEAFFSSLSKIFSTKYISVTKITLPNTNSRNFKNSYEL